MARFLRPPSILAGWLLLSACVAALAAGGHFDVDDAVVIEPGHCQCETWLLRAPAAATTLLHFGPGCRVGPVEVGVNIERLSTASVRRDLAGPQLKWVADSLIGPLSAGLVWSATYDLLRGGRPAQAFYAPATWVVNHKLALNADLGADFDFAGMRTRRLGASGEWAANEKLTLLAERAKVAGDWVSRIGTRFSVNDAISVDLSAARVGPRATPVYVIGLNHDFAR